jgi:hypothetical protein
MRRRHHGPDRVIVHTGDQNPLEHSLFALDRNHYTAFFALVDGYSSRAAALCGG